MTEENNKQEVRQNASATPQEPQTEPTTVLRRPHHHYNPARNADQTLPVRQWLNAIFMLGALVGVIIYFAGSTTVATFVILGAMVFKIVECAIRFIH